jgi:hypothetical protein
MNSIIRSPRPSTNYSVVANEIIENEALSYKARGLLISLLAKPDDWRVSFNHLVNAGKEGREAIRSAIVELEEAGYMVRVKTRDKNGKFSTDTYVFDTPKDTESTIDGLPHTGNRQRETVNGNPYHIISTNNQVLNTNTQKPLEVKLPSENPEPVKEKPVNNEEISRKLTLQVWAPIARGKTSQASKSVQATIKQALDNGAEPTKVAEAIVRIISDGNPILEWSLTKALAEKPKPKFNGTIAADKKHSSDDYKDPDFWSKKTGR